MSEKIQKVLARAGYGSRRKIEKWIELGRITIDGHRAKLGDRVTIKNTIAIDGKPCQIDIPSEKIRVLMYHKPIGEISTRNDPEGRPTVFTHLPPLEHGRWISIGRLDINTSGLLLFTNSGELANEWMHPRAGIEREYAVRVHGDVTADKREQLLRGVELEDGLARFKKIINVGGEGTNHWFKVIVAEGKNRIVRRLWNSQGCDVSRLIRIRFGSIQLPENLKPGDWLELKEDFLDQ